MIAIVDYEMGNVASVANMLKRIGVPKAEITRDPELIRHAEKVILPGVGSFDKGMRNLAEFGLLGALHEVALEQRIPVLGICLGMQLLTEASEEGTRPGLGWIKGRTIRFPFRGGADPKVPHMGWNYVRVARTNPIMSESDRSRYYFVHSYYVQPEDGEDVVATCRYGFDFPCAVGRANILGVQFHPEKSHRFGMALLQRFVEL